MLVLNWASRDLRASSMVSSQLLQRAVFSTYSARSQLLQRAVFRALRASSMAFVA
jgi:hypothetical protein